MSALTLQEIAKRYAESVGEDPAVALKHVEDALRQVGDEGRNKRVIEAIESMFTRNQAQAAAQPTGNRQQRRAAAAMARKVKR